MLITHYRFALPASFDMDSVRQRIRDRASVFDALPALGWKAFLVSDRSRQRGADNAYAPVYFWPGTDGWLDFLRGPLFAGVTEAFGHTAPWTGADFHWHIEIIPKLTKVAGFEWGTGFYINPTPPEEAARFLREIGLP